MDDPRVEACLAERAEHELMVDARHLDSHDLIGQVGRLASFSDMFHRCFQTAGSMLNGRRLNDDLSVEVT